MNTILVTTKIFLSYLILSMDIGRAYILSLKDGNNSIIIIGGANSAYDSKMTELDPKWAESIRKGKKELYNNR